MNASAGMDLIRSFFSSIDNVIYSLISILYELLLQLARTSIFTTTDIENFASRVYIFLGIIMLFKVTFSLINYLVDPDAITDKTKGAGNIAKNIVVTLFLIIIVPYAFDLLYNAQAAILHDNLIPRLILGTTDGDFGSQDIIIDSNICLDDSKEYIPSTINDVGDYIALTTFKPFFQAYNDGSIDYNADVSVDTISSFCSSKTVRQMLKFDKTDTAVLNTGKYVFDYSFLLSTATGILVLLLLLEFCFDVAMRCVKLGFLEIIAPIPIISYIDPNSGKNGMFKKWTKEVTNTWARLFIRLAILFFAIYAITIINNNLGTLADQENGMWIMLFLVIGALLFAKKAVQLIEDILGIKFDHSIQLNPFKKISDQALGGKQLMSLPGKTLSTAVGGAISAGGLIYANRKRSSDFNTKNNDYLNAKKQLATSELNHRKALDNYNNAKSRRELEASRLEQEAIDFYNQQDEWNPTNAKQYTDLVAKANQMKTTASADEERFKKLSEKTAAEIEAAKLDVDSKKTDLDKKAKENDVFSYNHPYVTTMLQLFRGAKLGFDAKDTANLAKAVTEGINAAKKATKLRNDYDKFGFMDRLKDLGTDLTGVKNESGTTSAIKAAMKEQNENLTNIKNGIMSLNQALANVKPGSIVYDQKGTMTISDSFAFGPGEKENLQKIIDNYNMLRKAEKETTKQIKEFEEIMNSKGGKDK